MVTVDAYKQLNRAMWSLGDYGEVAKLLEPGAVALVERLVEQPELRHLDVATGNGNVALQSALRGSKVTGLDLTSEFFADARRRAREAGVEFELIEGDGEALPFPDASFDIVTSTFGIQFAPRHEVAAAELVRVCKPGGRIGLCNWTPSSWTARLQEIVAGFFPPAPSFAGEPMAWGDERYLASLLGPEMQLASERRRLDYRFDSAEALVEFFERTFGPCIIARRAISSEARWHELHGALVEMTEQRLTDLDGATGVQPEYLLAVATKAG